MHSVIGIPLSKCAVADHGADGKIHRMSLQRSHFTWHQPLSIDHKHQPLCITKDRILLLDLWVFVVAHSATCFVSHRLLIGKY